MALIKSALSHHELLRTDVLHPGFDLSELPPVMRHAYNPALFEFGGQTWMFARTGAFRRTATHLLRVEGNALRYHSRMRLPVPLWKRGDNFEDFRFFLHSGRPHVSFTYLKTSWIAGWFRPQILPVFLAKLLRRKDMMAAVESNKWQMGYAELNGDMNIGRVFCLPGYPEKNWQFFSADNRLFAVYSIEPAHRVLEIKEGQIIEEWATPTTGYFDKTFGAMRGGTPPLLVNDKYWSFFHSVAEVSGKKYYYAGIYTFDRRAPFRVLETSSRPIIYPVDNADDLNNMPDPGLHNKYVIFPAGAILEGSKVHLSYGVNDSRMAHVGMEISWLQERLSRVVASRPFGARME